MEKNEEIMKNAQFRKSLSIAFFNATNAAIELVKEKPMTADETRFAIQVWRDWFLGEHKNYYAAVIANIGKNYDAKESIAKLKVAKTLEELQTAWRLLSEDERRDAEVHKEAQKLKTQYEKK